MNKLIRSKIIIIISIILISIITGFAAFYLAINGLLNFSFLGIDLLDWLFIILCLCMVLVIGYDFMKIQKNKKKFGKLKYTLKRKDKITQVIGFIFLIFILIFQVLFMIFFIRDIKFMNIALIFLIGMQPLMFAYHNYEKEGINDKCVYFWGTPIQWENIESYNTHENILYINYTKKVFGMNEKVGIPFKINNENKDEIIEFIDKRIIYFNKK